jgi:uncharacterized tellurite resistance protein B-like protein
MDKDDRIQYLANIYGLIRSDGKIREIEKDIYEAIAKDIGAGYLEKRDAIELSAKDDFRIRFVGRCSDRTRNIEDMLLAACGDADFHVMEKKIVHTFGSKLRISDEQFVLIKAQLGDRLKKLKRS